MPTFRDGPASSPPIPVALPNPARVSYVEPDFLWRQVVDAVDDYFRIESEQPVFRTNQSWLEGRLKTFPEISGTALEPWRHDAARGFERLQSTIQTIRRTATVRVTPDISGFLIDVQVIKEQEDVDQSQLSTTGASAQRHDGSIVRNAQQVRQLPVTLGWYEIGRDPDLEQRILQGIMGRVSNVEAPSHKFSLH
ncbi:MAG: hypothetical protein KDB03_16815 [Planctomycetales bacterium]|nr:hypothetical protein [Planctomycetales bacterium]